MTTSVAASTADLQSKIDIAVTRKVLDAQEQEGAAALSLLAKAEAFAKSSARTRGPVSPHPTPSEHGRRLNTSA